MCRCKEKTEAPGYGDLTQVLLETHTIDYIFLYRSVAQQHDLKYLLLPDEKDT